MSDISMSDVIQVLHEAADLALVHGPDPAGCIRAVVFGRPDVALPFWDTAESELVEEAGYRLQCHLNPDSVDADEDVTVNEWAAGRSVAEVCAAFFATAESLAVGVR